MAKKPRVKLPKSAKTGDVVLVKTLIAHKMETGLRKSKSGKTIPRLIIKKFVCSLDGTELFSADLHPSVSANPYIAFYIKAEKSGKYDFSWTDDNGKVQGISKNMVVS